ncbi:unnamed protein product [Lactuca saligna]|uniref:Methyltransferase small domain-containing protein n=1 Tax=Lactuca saligna TaxID=75948 RepID=A0AA35YUP9_LACSI|nr:unnamed protein product [Lactuca saligna]
MLLDYFKKQEKMEKPLLMEDMQGGLDYIVLSNFDIEKLCTISCYFPDQRLFGNLDYQLKFVEEVDLYEIDNPLKFTAYVGTRIHGLACWFDVLFNGSAEVVEDSLQAENSYGDVSNKIEVDFGCGCGTLCLATTLLDAEHVIGIDVHNESLEIASINVDDLKVEMGLIQCEIKNLNWRGWLDCPAYGHEIGCIVPSKVPLGQSFNVCIVLGKRYSFRQVIHQQRVLGRKLGLVIDLTNTSHYYCMNDWKKEGIKYHVELEA